MLDEHYLNPKLAAIYDLDSPWSVDRDFYLALAGDSPKTILDIGCGTGLLCDTLAAQGHSVTGMDPSWSMLEIARRKPHADKVNWVRSVAQHFESNLHFDLIIMTGHAFQVLLEDDDIAATFAMIQRQIEPDGLMAFESRNPAFNWKEHWDYDLDIELNADAIVHESRRFLSMHSNRMIFELQYQFPDETLISSSELRFSPRGEIEALLSEAGLYVDRLLGDWDGSLFSETASLEMIFMVRKNP